MDRSKQINATNSAAAYDKKSNTTQMKHDFLVQRFVQQIWQSILFRETTPQNTKFSQTHYQL